jgi:hypothetical protein
MGEGGNAGEGFARRTEEEEGRVEARGFLTGKHEIMKYMRKAGEDFVFMGSR